MFWGSTLSLMALSISTPVGESASSTHCLRSLPTAQEKQNTKCNIRQSFEIALLMARAACPKDQNKRLVWRDTEKCVWHNFLQKRRPYDYEVTVLVVQVYGVISLYNPTTTLQPKVLGFVWCTLSCFQKPYLKNNRSVVVKKVMKCEISHCAFIVSMREIDNFFDLQFSVHASHILQYCQFH